MRFDWPAGNAPSGIKQQTTRQQPQQQQQKEKR